MQKFTTEITRDVKIAVCANGRIELLSEKVPRCNPSIQNLLSKYPSENLINPKLGHLKKGKIYSCKLTMKFSYSFNGETIQDDINLEYTKFNELRLSNAKRNSKKKLR